METIKYSGSYDILILKSATKKLSICLIFLCSYYILLLFHSNSIVPGGLLVKSYMTRLTPRTSLIILDITLFNTS